MNYRRADMIELHDARTIIHARDYSDAFTGWVEFPGDADMTTVSGHDLSQFLEHYGYEALAIRGSGKYPRRVQDLEIEMTHHRPLVGSGSKHYNMETQEIISIEVEIPLSPNMLSFRVVFSWNSEGKESYATRYLTYCGAYTVWWAEMEESDDLGELGLLPQTIPD